MQPISVEKISLLDALSTFYPDSSKRTLRIWLKNKRVSVNGSLATMPNQLIDKNSIISVGKVIPVLEQGLKIIYEDDHLVVLDKPSGLLSVPLDKGRSVNAWMILKQYCQYHVYPVHRIDKETSGVMVFAKTHAAKEGLKRLFKEHDLTREYIALVEGHLAEEKGVWKSYLVEQENLDVTPTDTEQGCLAITHYEVLRTSAKCSWLKLILHTGRKHQIRVQSKEAGHVIVGDKRYDASMNSYKRLCLHAHRLAFMHPITQKKMDFTAESPQFVTD